MVDDKSTNVGGNVALVWPPLHPTMSNNAQKSPTMLEFVGRNVALVWPGLYALLLSINALWNYEPVKQKCVSLWTFSFYLTGSI